MTVYSMNVLPPQRPARAAAHAIAHRGGAWAGQAVLVAVAWLGTYAKAVVCGDDVDHLSAPYGSAIFLPNFAPGWIPNRVLDLYGRNLLARVFDLLFFPAHDLTGMDFLTAYKVFNATLFAAFLWLVHRCIMARLGPRPGALMSLFVAFAVLLIMPWTNEVRAVCYELPAFLLFVLLSEVFARLRGGEAELFSAGWLLALGFIAAFSLEGDAAILLATLLAAAMLARPWRVPGFWRGDAAWLGGLIGAFCGLALVTALAFSRRDGVSETFIPIKQYIAHFRTGAYLPADPAFYGQMLALGAAGLAAMIACRRRFAALCGFGGAAAPAAWAREFGYFALTGCVTLVVLALISMATNQSFFTFRAYPWGSLLITAMLFALAAVAASLAALADRAAPALVFVLVIATSRMAVAALGQPAAAYDDSAKVRAAYAAVVGGATGVVNTGLDLDSREMPLRPLPTADSPGWFIAAYQALFLKYYGVRTTATFR